MTDGEKLRRALDRVGLTAGQFGALVGRHRTTVSDWCRGEREVPPEAWVAVEMYRLLGGDDRTRVWTLVRRVSG